MTQAPEYTMTFDDQDSPVAKAAENPDLANDLARRVLNATNPAPEISDPGDTHVVLPAGLVVNDVVERNAEVQELTGAHEEALAKARTSGNAAKYVNTLLQCGVVSIGDRPVTNNDLASLLQGDLDALILGIRRATFGDEFEVFAAECPECGASSDITLNLADIPMKELEDPAQRTFEVELRKGRKAVIKFPTGAVQTEIYKKPMSVPEMNSLTLAECVLEFIEKDGTRRMSNGLTDVKNLGVADRLTLQEYIFNNQPGPRYDQVTAACSSCESEVPVPLNVGILFREL